MDLLKTGLFATLATTPALVFFFGSVAPVGIALGVIMVPIISIVVLPICLLTTILVAANAPEFMTEALVFVASAMMNALHHVLVAIDRPGLRIVINPDKSLLCATIILLIFWCWLRPKRIRSVITALSLFFFLSPSSPHAAPKGMTLRAFDVGHGDAFLITSGLGKTVLIDTGVGKANGRGSKLSPDRLHRLGISRIDLLLLSHRHPDHYGGAFRLIKEFPISRCIVARKGASSGNKLWLSLMKELQDLGVECEKVQSGDKIQISDLKIDFFAPMRPRNNLEEKLLRDENNWSIAARVSTPDGHIWSFGDASKELEIDIMGLNPTLPPGGVLLVPHHGSNTSSSEELLNRLQPSVAVVSHKRPLPFSVVERYGKRSIPLCGTSPGGTVHLRLLNGQMWVPMGCKSHFHTTQPHP